MKRTGRMLLGVLALFTLTLPAHAVTSNAVLVFKTPPADTVVNQNITGTPGTPIGNYVTVAVQSSSTGKTVTSFNGTIALTFGVADTGAGNPAPGLFPNNCPSSPANTVCATASKGVAQFLALSIDRTGTYSLNASSADLGVSVDSKGSDASNPRYFHIVDSFTKCGNGKCATPVTSSFTAGGTVSAQCTTTSCTIWQAFGIQKGDKFWCPNYTLPNLDGVETDGMTFEYSGSGTKKGVYIIPGNVVNSDPQNGNQPYLLCFSSTNQFAVRPPDPKTGTVYGPANHAVVDGVDWYSAVLPDCPSPRSHPDPKYFPCEGSVNKGQPGDANSVNITVWLPEHDAARFH